MGLAHMAVRKIDDLVHSLVHNVPKNKHVDKVVYKVLCTRFWEGGPRTRFA